MSEEERSGEGFLARWSRLKRSGGERSRQEPPPTVTPGAPSGVAPATEPVPPPPVAARAEAVGEPEPEPELDLSSLPPIETLTAESDISVFLRKGVPAALRNAALRRVWSLDPTIRDFIGPADYAWDWNVPGGAPGYVAEIASGPDVEALADRILGLVRRERAEDKPGSPSDGMAGEAPDAGGAEGAGSPPQAAIRLSESAGRVVTAPDAIPPATAPAVPASLEAPADGQASRGGARRPRHGGATPT